MCFLKDACSAGTCGGTPDPLSLEPEAMHVRGQVTVTLWR
jgi:hypothetical protein